MHFDCLYRGITAVSSRESKILAGNRIIAQVIKFLHYFGHTNSFHGIKMLIMVNLVLLSSLMSFKLEQYQEKRESVSL